MEQPLVSPEEVASVLSTGGEGGATQAEGGEPAGSDVYSLRRPVAIAPEAEPEARKRIERFARALVETICRDLETEIEFELTGFQQQQAGLAMESLPEPCWLLTFAHAAGGGISLVMDGACAMSLVELALGGVGNSPASSREPTSLESRVMGNLGGALVKPLSAGARTEFTRGIFSVAEIPPSLAARGEIVGAALLRLKFSGAERSGMLLVSSSLLRENPTPPERPAARKPGPLARRLELVPVGIRPVLKAGLVSLSDLTALRGGAVLRLEAPEDQTLELRIDGQVLFNGVVRNDGDNAEFRVMWRRGRAAAGAEEESS